MKFSFLIIILMMGIFSCSRSENIQNSAVDSTPILEISEDAQGMRDVTGKSLFFRLYKNGNVEFEYPDNKKKISGRAIYTVKEVNSLLQTKVNDDELQKFIVLLSDNDLSNVQNIYKRKCCCTDAITDFQLKINLADKQQNISLNSYCGVEELKSPQDNFPKHLSKLMTLTDNTRWKYIPH